jgi:sulfotransferase family protein
MVAERRVDALGHRGSGSRASLLGRLTSAVERQFLPHYFSKPPGWRLGLRRRLDGERTLPDFCIVGPIKSGTTDLAVSMMAHPNVIPPVAKEFWSPDPHSWRVFYPTEHEKERHAKRYGVALSPYCVPALHSMEVAYNLSQVKPDCKVVVLLRDPAARTYSQWKWEVFLAGRKRLATHPFLATFESYVSTALELFPASAMPSTCGFPVLQTSIYWQSVAYWIKCFGRANVLVVDADDYFEDCARCLHRIQEFVGLPAVSIPQFADRINENPLTLPKPADEAMASLRKFFAPHNEKLWQVIGETYDWHRS